ncbi:MAG: RluA family pseudouridine synthase [Bacteroidetes bacterium]|nr:RluA family pseudouridine synthase [Bacteroidota bacterium]MDA1288429.1 RluA family pseudouridine synthase [Bacteroidota bacterium]
MENDDHVQEDEFSNSDLLYEHFSFKADLGQSPLRVDKFLMSRIENATRNKIQQAAKTGSIHVDGQPVKSNFKVKGGNTVKVLFTHPPYENLLVPEAMELDIVYEDDYLVVLNKEAGLVVHPGHGNYAGTLLNGLLHHFTQLPKNSNDRPGLVHRIDKDTSGLLVVAKTESAMTHLAQQFFEKTSERKYKALVWGDFETDQGTYTGAIGRHPKNRLQMAVFEDNSEGKQAVTHFKVVERFGYVTLVECQLETGRTHQIRAHMKYYGHPLFNDARYGGDAILKGTNFTKYKQFVENCFKILPRQALHAETLGFVHPVTGEKMQFETPIPPDMEKALEKWRHYAKHKNL